MEQKKLGCSELFVSRIGLGLAALGRPGYINIGHSEDLAETLANDHQDASDSVEAMEAHAFDILDAAYALGVRYFDAARSYGKAELFLGNWLRNQKISPEIVTIGSKWGYTYTANWQVEAEVHEVKEHSQEVLARQWDESQRNLADYLDLYQIHSATLESGVLDNLPVLNKLGRIKEQGTAVGLTVSGMDQARVIEKALEVELDGARLFDTVQATWNLLETSAGPALSAAQQGGVGVIIKEALANGRLTPRNPQPEFQGKMDLLHQEAKRLNTSIDALAIAGVLAQPWVDVVLSGAARIGHLESNIKALQVKWDNQAAEQLSALQETPQVYWQTRSSLVWN